MIIQICLKLMISISHNQNESLMKAAFMKMILPPPVIDHQLNQALVFLETQIIVLT